MSKKNNQLPKNILGDLFGSKTRVKVLKFLFRNYPAEFTVKEAAKRIQETTAKVGREFRELTKVGLIKKK